MKRLLPLLGAVAACVLALSACSGGKNAVDQSAGGQFRFVNITVPGKTIPEAKREKAGPVSGDLLDGGTYNLNADAGKVVVINLWGTWCGPCLVETPQFDSVYRELKPQGVDFVGFDVKEASKDKPRSYVADNKISYPIVWDPNAKVALQLGKLPVVGLPVTVVIDKQQRVAAVYSGPVQPADLTPVLKTLISES